VFEQRDNTSEWARKRNITRKCFRCGRDKDVHEFDFELTYLCLKCAVIIRKERAEELRLNKNDESLNQQKGKNKIKGLFDNIIWPE
jgi:hypothetical protein